MRKDLAREISYASSARTRGGRAVVRVLENATGRLGLIRRANGYEDEVARGRDFWSVIVERYGLSLDVVGGSLTSIPANGPLVLVANHPYGILDGLMMGHILSQVRGDFRIVDNRIFTDHLAWFSVDQPTIARVMAELTARGADAADLYFQYSRDNSITMEDGIISRASSSVDQGVGLRVVVGEPIPRASLQAFGSDAKQMMDFLRRATYDLSPRPLISYDYGFEFEEKYRA